MLIEFLENEYWYGGCVKYGIKMPIKAEDEIYLDFRYNHSPNQATPVFLSTKGRYIYADRGFSLRVENKKIEVEDYCKLAEGKNDLKGAYLAAMKSRYPYGKKLPARELFEKPIYNSWIELLFNQNQEDILSYARSIIKNNMPAGVLMIDDGWSDYYGNWSFSKGKFPNPKEMLKELKGLGFNVMLWVCPFVTPDTVAFRDARDKDILIKSSDGDTFITKWWNGYSAVLDMTNDKAKAWLKEQLDSLVELGVKGFKFDAGDSDYYREDIVTAKPTNPDLHSKLWAEFGAQYSYNEYRVCYDMGGKAILQRLCDKEHSWGDNGIKSLVPDTLLQGLLGYAYGCPDMIGGGEYLNFVGKSSDELDKELFIRHCEIAALMPAMQFSVAPFRILDNNSFKYILSLIKYREKYIDYILKLFDETIITGEPIIRYLSYEFPDEGFEMVTDCFMLGNKYLVSPICEKNLYSKSIRLPKGKWKLNDEIIESAGKELSFEANLGDLLVFERLL